MKRNTGISALEFLALAKGETAKMETFTIMSDFKDFPIVFTGIKASELEKWIETAISSLSKTYGKELNFTYVRWSENVLPAFEKYPETKVLVTGMFHAVRNTKNGKAQFRLMVRKENS